MREIKFRAWEKSTDSYLYNIEYAYDTLSGMVKDSSGNNVDYSEEVFGNFLNNDSYVVEQSTGLKDVNGVDIYEGDLVREVSEYDDDDMVIYEIVYNETSNYPAFDLKGWRGEMNGISELSLTIGIEVVGNIHQNMDLLEEK